jgi:hypothetical protein
MRSRFPEVEKFCIKCGRINKGRPYSVTVSSRRLEPRIIRWGNRGLHKECAFAWVERIRATPERWEEIPKVSSAHERYKRAQAKAAEIAAHFEKVILKELEDSNQELSSAIWDYHQEQVRGLKGGPPMLHPESEVPHPDENTDKNSKDDF